MAKVVLINAYEVEYLGTRVLASYLRMHGHDTHNILLELGGYIGIEEPLEKHHGYQSTSRGCLTVNKASFKGMPDESLVLLNDVLWEEHPDIIGFSARSTNNWLVPLLVPVFNKAIPGALLVAGGFGPTLEPEVYLNGGFDVVVRCDGEEALLALAQQIDRHKDHTGKWECASWGIPNTVCFSHNGAPVYHPLRSQERNLSKYGMPLHEHDGFTLINDGTARRKHDPTLEAVSYHTYYGRGCTGRCSYCSGGQWSALYRSESRKAYPRRNREVDEIIDELRKMPETVRSVWFVDEYFALSSQKTIEFCRLYKKYINKPFFTYLNYAFILKNKDFLDMLMDAGLRGTGVGFQTGSEEFASACYNRKFKNIDLLDYTHMLFENNINVGIHIIGGNCYETDEVFQETIDLVKQLPVSLEAPSMMRLENIRLRPHPRSPIITTWPKVVSNPMTAKEWFYRGLLLEFARLLDEQEFASLRAHKPWRDDPAALARYFKETLRNMQVAHFKKLIAELSGKPVVFYGAGELYHKNKSFFKDISPVAIICDEQYYTCNSIDNIPVFTCEKFMKEHYDSEIIFLTFIGGYASWARHSLHYKYKVPNEKIHSCTRVLA